MFFLSLPATLSCCHACSCCPRTPPTLRLHLASHVLTTSWALAWCVGAPRACQRWRMSRVVFPPAQIATGGMDKDVKLFDIASSTVGADRAAVPPASPSASVTSRVPPLWVSVCVQTVATLHGHGKKVSSVILHPSVDAVLSASYDSTVKVWNKQGTLAAPFFSRRVCVCVCTTAWVRAGAWSLAPPCVPARLNHTERLCSLSLCVFPLPGVSGGSYAASFTLKPHTDAVVGMALQPSGDYLISASVDKTWSFSNITTGRVLATIADESVTAAYTCVEVRAASPHPNAAVQSLFECCLCCETSLVRGFCRAWLCRCTPTVCWSPLALRMRLCASGT